MLFSSSSQLCNVFEVFVCELCVVVHNQSGPMAFCHAFKKEAISRMITSIKADVDFCCPSVICILYQLLYDGQSILVVSQNVLQSYCKRLMLAYIFKCFLADVQVLAKSSETQAFGHLMPNSLIGKNIGVLFSRMCQNSFKKFIVTINNHTPCISKLRIPI